jgi:hypothetical protein
LRYRHHPNLGQSSDEWENARLFPKAAHCVLPKLIPIMMIAPEQKNSWSKLLTSIILSPGLIRLPKTVPTIVLSDHVSNPAQNCTARPCHPNVARQCQCDAILKKQCCRLVTAQCPPVGERVNWTMKPFLCRLRNRLYGRLAFISDSFAKLLAALKPGGRDFRSQRMCPFCGLITSRYKRCCLECGKSLKPA